MKQFQVVQDRIEFLDNRFYKTSSGAFVPSVTTILEAYPKDASYFQWIKSVGSDADTIRDEAGKRGTIVHELTERYDMGYEISCVDEQGRPQYKMLEWAMFERYVDFTNEFKPNVELMELHMASEKLGYAGTLDRVITMDGKTYLVDIKTSNSIYPSYWLQLAAYRELLGDLHKIDGVAILWLNAKTRTRGKKGDIQGVGWQMVIREDSTQDLKLFNNTFELWKALNEDIKPRVLSYNLKHQKNDL